MESEQEIHTFDSLLVWFGFIVHVNKSKRVKLQIEHSRVQLDQDRDLRALEYDSQLPLSLESTMF